MYRRVGAPILLAVGVWIGVTLLGFGCYFLTKGALDSLIAGKAAWLLPVLPLGGWPILLVVFAAVRMCALRGGSRRECILVGLSPVVPGALLYAYLLSQCGFSALPTLAGITSPVISGGRDFAAMIAARQYAASFVGLVATCVTQTWLYLWVGGTTATPASAA
ncbi:MAG: hypothetical protein MUQ65_15035 [Armatimonadetes bacterium]|nr:hypothetical protein [Armatimonadota bacterium]